MAKRPAVFRASSQPTRSERITAYDERRGSAASRGYGTRWQKARRTYLMRHPLCVMCEREGRITAAGVVDHVIPHRGDQDLFWDTDNWQSLCKPHHDREKQREDRASGSGRELDERRLPSDLQPSRIPLTIVCGPPGSGKSTYIAERIGPDDILIDLDEIMQGLSGLPVHQTSKQWLVPAMDERNRRLRLLADDEVHDRAWFIVSAPKPDERALWRDRLGGELVVMRTPIEICIERILADPTRAGQTDRMIKAARAWWSLNQR